MEKDAKENTQRSYTKENQKSLRAGSNSGNCDCIGDDEGNSNCMTSGDCNGNCSGMQNSLVIGEVNSGTIARITSTARRADTGGVVVVLITGNCCYCTVSR